MILRNNFETGLADETAITVANSDDGTAGNAWDAHSFASGGTGVYDTGIVAHGTLAGKFIQGANDVCYVEWAASMGTKIEVYGRAYNWQPSTDEDNRYAVQFMNGGSVAAVIYLSLLPGDRRFYVFNADFAANQVSTLDFPEDQWVRLEFHLVCHATLGEIHAKVFLGDSTTLYDEARLQNTNTLSQITVSRFGQANTRIGNFSMDDIELNDIGWPGAAISEKQSFYASRRRAWR